MYAGWLRVHMQAAYIRAGCVPTGRLRACRLIGSVVRLVVVLRLVGWFLLWAVLISYVFCYFADSLVGCMVRCCDLASPGCRGPGPVLGAGPLPSSSNSSSSSIVKYKCGHSADPKSFPDMIFIALDLKTHK